MGHHSMDEPSQEMLIAMEKMKRDLEDDGIEQKVLAADSPKFGATGKFPDGSIYKTDEGEIQFSVSSHRGRVILNFGKPVAWLGLDAGQCAELAGILLHHAAR